MSKSQERRLKVQRGKLSERGSIMLYEVDGIGGEFTINVTDEVAKLEAEITQLRSELDTIKAWGFKPEASAVTLGEAIMELQDQLHGVTKERDALVANFVHNTQLLMDAAHGLYIEEGVAIEEATRKKDTDNV